MVKLFTLLTKLVFIANYGIALVAFNYYLNHYDFGEWDHDGWNFMLSGGLISGILALLFELRLYRKLEFWPKSLSLFLVRQIFSGVAFSTLGFMIGLSIPMELELVQSPGDVLLLAVLPFMIALYLPLLAPFGIAAGLINGILFRMIHTVQAQKRLVENP